MTRSIILAAASVVALAAASPAFAQDAAPVAAAPVAVSAAPVGGRIEALLGWDRVGYDSDIHKSGLAYGIGVGYDFGFSPTMSAGIDAEVSDATTKKYGIHASRDLYIGGRLSFAAGDRANVYVKGGYTNARFTFDGDGTKLDGWRLGVGGQYAVNRAMYVGGEYRYSNYEHGADRNQIVGTVGARF